jgi:hypothetical protein
MAGIGRGLYSVYYTRHYLWGNEENHKEPARIADFTARFKPRSFLKTRQDYYHSPRSPDVLYVTIAYTENDVSKQI